MISNKKLAIFAALLALGKSAYGYSCEELKQNFEKKEAIQESLADLNRNLSGTDLCYKNLSGMLYAKGEVVPKDLERAYEIFYALSDEGYPQAQLNLGILLARRDSGFDVSVYEYLLGIYAKYYGDLELGHVGGSARDLAREYFQGCIKKANKVDVVEIEKHLEVFESAVREINFKTASNTLRQEQYLKDRNGAIVGLLSLGVLATKAFPSVNKALSGGSSGGFNRVVRVPQPQSSRMYGIYQNPNGGLYAVPLQ